MAFYHGIKTTQQATSVSTPVSAGCGIPFVVGTAPIHMTDGGKANVPILVNSYAEAVQNFGYSDDWEKYTLCEVIYSHFKLYGMKPLILVNVLDPEKAEHTENVQSTEFGVNDGKIRLPAEAVLSDARISATSSGEALTEGEDYESYYDESGAVIEILKSGSAASAAKLYVSYKAVKPSGVTSDDIIGGYDGSTGRYSGFELVDECYARFSVIPDLLLAPGFSHKSDVAAVMSQKARSQGELFSGMALVDVDVSSSGVRHYTAVNEWKKKNNIMSRTEVLCYPMITLGGRKFHLSTAMAGLCASVDYSNGDCPSESPSNKQIQADGLCLADGEEVILTFTQANYLNSIGVVTALSFIGGFRLWGNYTAAYPAETDVKDTFFCVARSFAWVANSVILSFWSKVDRKIDRLLLDNITDSVNMWLSALAAENKLIAARIECIDDENPKINLLAGKLKFHIYLTCPIPAQEIEFVLEYDVEKLADLFK